MMHAILLALHLVTAADPRTVATTECALVWETDSDGYHSCVDGLRAWAVEAHDRADAAWVPTLADVRWPDPVWAGEREWVID